MPFDVQWFIYALVTNGVYSRADAEALYASQGGGDLEAFAQQVLDRLTEGRTEEEQQSMLDWVQSIIDYAVEQGETGIPPEFPEEETTPSAAQSATPAPAQETGDGGDEELKIKGKHTGIVHETAVHFEGASIDLSKIQSYSDLPSLRDVSTLDDKELSVRLIELLASLRVLGCSDLHLSSGTPPFVRRMLKIERIDSYVLTEEDARRLNTVLLSPERKKEFADTRDVNFALEIGRDRFRVCLMEHKDGPAGSYRLVPDHLCTLEELGYLESDVVYIKRLLDYTNGLILVTGPIGSGKTTTLGAMVNIINEKRNDHIITVEDPIEILQTSKNCQVTQREIGKHTISYRTALKAALREDPDIIVIGEMHDLETIENAITASETGHLVIGTLHTGDAPNTLNRILDVFPPAQQAQIRAMVAVSLRGVVCQRLIPAANGGLTNAYEILINTMSVSNTIGEGKTFRLKSNMSTGMKQGMCTIDQCLLNKYMLDLVTYEVAIANMTDSSVIEQINREHAIREARKLKEQSRKGGN